MKRLTFALLCFTWFAPLGAEEVDLDVIHRIKTEAFQYSQVMDYMFLLSDEIGPRLSASPAYQRAADAVVQTMDDLGIAAEVQVAGKFGRSWSYSDLRLQMLTPQIQPLSALPMAWSAATDGPVQGSLIFAPLQPSADSPSFSSDLLAFAETIEAYKAKYAGKLAGKVVLVDWPVEFEIPQDVPAPLFDDAGIAEVAAAPPPLQVPPLSWPHWKSHEDTDIAARVAEDMPTEIEADLWDRYLAITNRFYSFLNDEGIAAILKVSTHPFVGGISSDDYGSFLADTTVAPPTAIVMREQYNRLARLVENGVAVDIELDVDAVFHEENADLRNVVATIPGQRKRDEIVMLGGHLDSWIGGTGASDNASGCAVAMEAMRILKALDLKMDRTVRMALWDGEEQNYYGSRAYVKENFGDSITMQLEPDHRKFSAYYNIDNGAGKFRGVYLQSNDATRPIFEAWLAPFADLDADTVSIRNTYATDHKTFDSIGLPGFQFIQDELEYELHTHHTNLDTIDHIVPGDLMQAAAILASIVYHTANRDDLMPRKPLPDPLPEKQEIPELIRY